MTRRSTAILTALALVFSSFAPAQAANSKKEPCSEGLAIPLQASRPDQGSFVGILKINRFARDGGGIVAVGLVTGTLTDEFGAVTAIVRTVSLPLQLPATASAQAAAAGVVIQQTCDILHLTLGPLHLDLLGLIIDLDQVNLDITADPAGGLLGALLCAIAGLLDDSSPTVGLLNQIVGLLNQILAILT